MERINMNVVTSFTEEGYELYGRNFLDSYIEYWPQEVKITVYFEGDKFPNSNELVTWKPIDEVEHLVVFMDALKFKIMSGITDQNIYNINYDARMARKVFIQMHAMKTMQGKVFWLDADTVTFDYISKKFLNKCLPDNVFNCYLGRDGWYYTESGFIGFNASHSIAPYFYHNYLKIYLDGIIFTQPGWHDCFGFDLARKQFDPIHFNNLAKELPHGTMHPFVNSELGCFMDHRKGKRKYSRSNEMDLVIKRNEPYWKEKNGQ